MDEENTNRYRVVISGIGDSDVATSLALKLDMAGRREAGIVITVQPDRDGIPPYDEETGSRHWQESL